MDHTGAEDLYPAFAFAGRAALASALVTPDVHLTAGLRKREVVRAETRDGPFSVELFNDQIQCGLEIRHRDALVYDHAFDLMEHG